jgi:hypothetical protein
MCGVQLAELPQVVPDLRVRRFGTHYKERRYWVVKGILPENHFRLFNSSIDNLLHAIQHRVFLAKYDGVYQRPVNPLPNVFTQRLSEFRNLVIKRIPSTTPVSFANYANSYQGRKKKLYEKAAESLSTKPFDASDAVVKAFMKVERQNFSDKTPVPRLIQPRGPRYNIFIGRHLRPLEKLLYRSVDLVYNSKTVFKGYNAHETGMYISDKWGKFANPVAVMTDITRYDEHHRADAMRWEHSIYNNKCRDVDLARALELQVSSPAIAVCKDGMVKYQLEAMASGVYNTSMGAVAVVCGILYSYIKEHDFKCEVVNCGDDCVLILDEDDVSRLDHLSRWFLDFGFMVKVESVVHKIENISFCQSRPVFDGERYVMVRELQTALYKDTLSTFDLTDKTTFRRWMGAVGECGLSLTGGIPIYQSWYNLFIRTGGANNFDSEVFKNTGLYYMSRRMERSHCVITDAARVSFYYAFGVPPNVQIVFEEKFDNATLAHDSVGQLDADWIALFCDR